MSNTIKIIFACLLLSISLCAPAVYGQGAYGGAPNVFATAATGLGLTYSSGTLYQGGAVVSIVTGTLSATDSKTNCAAPAFSSCNFVYWNTGTGLGITTTYATAFASGNILVAYVTTAGGNITLVTPAVGASTPAGNGGVLRLISSVTGSAGDTVLAFTNTASTLNAPLITTGATGVGYTIGVNTTANANVPINITPKGSGVLNVTGGTDPTKVVAIDASGNSTGITQTLAFSATSARTATFPDASITVPGTVINDCGTANACSATLKSAASKIVIGHTATLNGASPSVAAVTGMPAFGGTTNYVCTATLESASASTVILAVSYVSASAVTFTAGNGTTGVVSYICIGN